MNPSPAQQVIPFEFPTTGQPLHSIDIAGTPWFLANDACAILGIANIGNALARLDEDEKSSIRLADGTPGNPNKAIVNEPGLYALILRSDKPGAKKFKRWVTHEVLPAIRKTGSYNLATPAFQLPQTFAEALELAARQARELDANRDTIRELQGPAAAWDTLAEAHGDYSVREAAQILDRDPNISTGQNRLFAHMRNIGWLDGKGEPYQAQVDNGRLVRRTTSYTHPHTSEPVLASQVRVTPKGVEALRRTLTGGQLAVIPGGA
jgi:prophage antirepressor-like protein